MSSAPSTSSPARSEAAQNGAAATVFGDARYQTAQANVDRLTAHLADVQARQRANEASLEEHRSNVSSMRRAAGLLAGSQWTRSDVLDACISAQRELQEEYRAVTQALAMAEGVRDRVVQEVSRQICLAVRPRIVDFARRKIAAARALAAIQDDERAWLDEMQENGNSLNGIMPMRPLVRKDLVEYAVTEFNEFYGVEL